MANIYLVGFMGTGKTTVGRLLAQELGRKFIEMDEVIEEREGRKIVDIFRQSGEPYFRRLEKELLIKLSKADNLVVSCGGGVVCDEENLKVLKSSGTVFNLKAEAAAIYERTKNYTSRPLLNVKDPLKRIEDLLQKRAPFYAQAHHTINTVKMPPEEVAQRIREILSYG